MIVCYGERTTFPTIHPQPVHLDSPQEVELSNRHALLPENSIRHRLMEEKVRQRKRLQIAQPSELELLWPSLDNNLLVLLALESSLAALSTLEHLKRLVDADVKLIEGGLIVLHLDLLEVGDTREHALGAVGAGLHLEDQGEHVVGEFALEEALGRDIVVFGPGFAFLEKILEVCEGSDEERDA